jgi:MFS family permease
MSNNSLSSPGEIRPGFFRYYTLVIGAFLSLVAAALVVVGFGVFFTPMSSQFGWTHAETSWAVSIMTVVSGFLGVVAGRICDRFNPRPVIIIGGVLEGLSYLFLSRTSSLWMLYVGFGILIGVGMANIPPLVSLVTRFYTRRRGVMIGITMAGAGVGGTIAPPLSLYFISTYGWQNAYLILGCIVLAVVAASGFLLYYSRQRSQPLIDPTLSQEKKRPEIKELSPQQAVHTGSFWILGIVVFCFSFIFQALTVHLVPGAADLRVSTATAASLLSIINLTNMVSSFGMGVVADRIGSFLSILISQFCMAAGLLLLLFVREPWALYLFAILFGAGFGIINFSRSLIIADLFGLISHSVIYGVMNLFLSIGGTIGPIAAGYIFDLTGHYQITFIILAGLSLISLIMTLPLGSRVKKAQLTSN